MITDKPRFPIREMLCHGWLPSFLKCALYRVRGYKIGHRVRTGFGSVICANKAEIGNDVRVGFFSFFRGRELRLGDRVRIGSACFLDTPHLEIGDDSKFNENVYVGGLQFPDSRLTVGKNCQIMQMTFINPTKYITIGDDTGIGGDSLLFGQRLMAQPLRRLPGRFSTHSNRKQCFHRVACVCRSWSQDRRRRGR